MVYTCHEWCISVSRAMPFYVSIHLLTTQYSNVNMRTTTKFFYEISAVYVTNFTAMLHKRRLSAINYY